MTDDTEAKGTEVDPIEVKEVEVDDELEMERPKNRDKGKEQESTPSNPIVNPYVSPLPFLNRLKAHKVEE